MDGAIEVFGPAYRLIDARLADFLGAGVSRVIAEVAAPFRAALILYVLLYGIAILRGAIAEPVMDFAVRSLKLALIAMLATTSAYGDWVTQPLFQGLPDALARAVGGGGAADTGESFDQFLNRSAYLGEKIARDASMLDPVPWIVSVAVMVTGALCAALGFGVVTLAKVALALLVALGPIFIACALFEATRRYFFGWLGQAINYLVLFALLLSVFQLVLALVAERWAEIDGQDPMAAGLLFIALCLLGAIFFLQTPAIAAGIAGGASIGLADFRNAASGQRSGASIGAGRSIGPPQGGSVRMVRNA